jgi:16S rRNA (cytidine1402-2'-O)-methyltransferase
VASGKDAVAGADPNHRSTASKPGRTRSARAPDLEQPARGDLPGDIDSGTEIDGERGDWTPKHTLAPGLHLVATPIGNLGDITLRALWVLRNVDRILCEDTRVTARLLARYAIKKPLDPYHDHIADRVRPAILEALRRGATLALVADAGTPLVADPGFKLVRAALAEDLPVTAAPGPSAALTALTLSGLPPDPFLFAGFLPPRSAARRRTLANWPGLAATLIFFEGPSRLAAALADMALILGDRSAAVARELTKRHEEIRRGRLGSLAEHYRGAGAPRGEAVIVVGPPETAPTVAEGDVDLRLRALLAGHSLRDAVVRLAGETGIPRRVLYERALALQEGDALP